MPADGESAFPSVGVPTDELRFKLRVINTEFDDVTVLIAGVALFTTRLTLDDMPEAVNATFKVCVPAGNTVRLGGCTDSGSCPGVSTGRHNMKANTIRR
jgi:hypothetical protein